MKVFVLLVLFATAQNQTPHAKEGFSGVPFQTLEECLHRREIAEINLKHMVGNGAIYEAFCAETTTVGFEEAFARLAQRSEAKFAAEGDDL